MPSVNPSIWAYQKRRRKECFFIELLSLFPLHSVNFEGLDMVQFNTELVS
ncbi:hypothetical protein BDE02_03G012600 [Populus trichocarpa]|nr:hypothetical protein BDE02_03G012600 [Populus trichocarpa]